MMSFETPVGGVASGINREEPGAPDVMHTTDEKPSGEIPTIETAAEPSAENDDGSDLGSLFGENNDSSDLDSLFGENDSFNSSVDSETGKSTPEIGNSTLAASNSYQVENATHVSGAPEPDMGNIDSLSDETPSTNVHLPRQTELNSRFGEPLQEPQASIQGTPANQESLDNSGLEPQEEVEEDLEFDAALEDAFRKEEEAQKAQSITAATSNNAQPAANHSNRSGRGISPSPAPGRKQKGKAKRAKADIASGHIHFAERSPESWKEYAYGQHMKFPSKKRVSANITTEDDVQRRQLTPGRQVDEEEQQEQGQEEDSNEDVMIVGVRNVQRPENQMWSSGPSRVDDAYAQHSMQHGTNLMISPEYSEPSDSTRSDLPAFEPSEALGGSAPTPVNNLRGPGYFQSSHYNSPYSAMGQADMSNPYPPTQPGSGAVNGMDFSPPIPDIASYPGMLYEVWLTCGEFMLMFPYVGPPKVYEDANTAQEAEKQVIIARGEIPPQRPEFVSSVLLGVEELRRINQHWAIMGRQQFWPEPRYQPSSRQPSSPGNSRKRAREDSDEPGMEQPAKRQIHAPFPPSVPASMYGNMTMGSSQGLPANGFVAAAIQPFAPQQQIPAPPNYYAKRVEELKEELRRRNLMTSGLKQALIERLQASDAQTYPAHF